MNKLYKISFLSFLGITSASVNVSAQTAVKDTTLNRHVNLEREYTPSIKDASKINTLPALYQPQKKQYNIQFENAIPSVNLSNDAIGDTGSGDIKTNIDYSKHKGYLLFGAGMYTNLEGALGYRIVDAPNDQLDIFATHSFTNARIKYLFKDSPLDEVKAYDMENLIKLTYKHSFDAFIWHLRGSYLNNAFNYYGNPYIIDPLANTESFEKSLKDKQTANVLELETGIASNPTNSVLYSGNIKYNRFSQKYGPDKANRGISANLIDVTADVAVPFEQLLHIDDFKIGARGRIFHQGCDPVQYETSKDQFYDLSLIQANPYISLGEVGDAILLEVGAKLNYAIDYNDKTRIAPKLKLLWNFAQKNSFYINVDGGVNDNNLVSIHRENKYANPFRRIAISQTHYDMRTGIKSGAIAGFEFDIFGGYKYTKNEHLYTQVSASSWANVSDALYANLTTGHLGGSLHTRLIPNTDVSMKVVGYFYNVKEYSGLNTHPSQKRAWGLPNMTFDLNADFHIIDNLVLTAHYAFEGGRKTYLNSQSIKMSSVNDLSFRANYQVLDWFSVYGKINNIMNQRYERYYGYTLQGINALIGASLKF
ncbi:MAG: hypothetical protein RL662_421 [Bacteroidota bacterium]|jgi:hypothetical protein